MNAYHRYKNRLEQYLQSERGKRAIHFAYSFGAALVILGAMFKLLHFPFGNEMLFIGMVTEVCVFILSAIGIDRALQDEAAVVLGIILVHAAAGVTGELVIAVERVMTRIFLERQDAYGKPFMLAPGPALAAAGPELRHRYSY